MVFIKINQGTQQFIVEAKTTDSVDDVTQKVARVHNLRMRIDRLVHGARQLAKYGPMRPEKHRGLSKEQIEACGNEETYGSHLDPLGKYTVLLTSPVLDHHA